MSFDYAELDDHQKMQIQTLEEQLGCVLIAFDDKYKAQNEKSESEEMKN